MGRARIRIDDSYARSPIGIGLLCGRPFSVGAHSRLEAAIEFWAPLSVSWEQAPQASRANMEGTHKAAVFAQHSCPMGRRVLARADFAHHWKPLEMRIEMK